MAVNGERLRMARLIRGLSSPELADLIGISKQAVWQYEKGETAPSPDTMFALCRTLGFPYAFFQTGQNDQIAAGASFCRTVSATSREEKERQRQLNVLRTYLCLFFQNYVAFPQPPTPDFTAGDCGSMDGYTRRLRLLYGLGDSPIGSMANFLENLGVVLATYRHSADKFDAISQQITVNGGACRITAYNLANTTFARLQFTLAHELGHWLLGHLDGDAPDREHEKECEQAANAFAASLLLPAETFGAALYNPLDLNLYVALKESWHVSVAMMVKRAYDLGLLDSRQYQNLYRQLSRRGWRTQEPLDDALGVPSPTLLPQTVRVLDEAGILPASTLAQTLAAQVFPAGQTLYEELLSLPPHALDPAPQTEPKVRVLPFTRE